MERKQEYWAFLVVCHIDFIVIPEKILQSPSLNQEYCQTKDR